MGNRVKITKASYIVNPEKIGKHFLDCATLVNGSVEACEQTVKVGEAHVELLIG